MDVFVGSFEPSHLPRVARWFVSPGCDFPSPSSNSSNCYDAVFGRSSELAPVVGHFWALPRFPPRFLCFRVEALNSEGALPSFLSIVLPSPLTFIKAMAALSRPLLHCVVFHDPEFISPGLYFSHFTVFFFLAVYLIARLNRRACLSAEDGFLFRSSINARFSMILQSAVSV